MIVRLYVDENVDRLLIFLLRVAGFDVVFSRDVLPAGISDHIHLLTAAGARRTLITHDKDDFRLLHHAWQDWFTAFAVSPHPQHSGILRLPQYPVLSTPQAVRLLETLLVESSPDDVANRLLEWSPMRGWEEVLPNSRLPFRKRIAEDSPAKDE